MYSKIAQRMSPKRNSTATTPIAEKYGKLIKNGQLVTGGFNTRKHLRNAQKFEYFKQMRKNMYGYKVFDGKLSPPKTTKARISDNYEI